MIGPISVDMKQAGERSAGKRPAAFDEAGAGNVATAAGLRATAKAVELPPEPNVRAPVRDPTTLGCVSAFCPEAEIRDHLHDRDDVEMPPVLQ
jgi:hypothetical protein